jgi:hypothetical protein
VAPGIAIDQFGRPVVIRTAQCARVGAWLAAQEQQAAAEEAPSPLAAHLGPSGDLTLYVVAEHATCLDALVPLPGNPCGSDDQVTAASRIRDSWRVGFRWEPPAMPHWDGVRALADLLVPVELDDGSPVVSDEDLLAEHIRALVPGAPPPSGPLPDPVVLPRADARAALDRLLTIWVTEVRPGLLPDLLAPDGDAAVLLSAVTFVPADPFDPAGPAITDFLEPDDEGRPYLAPTQLVQELVAIGGGGTTILAGSPVEVPEPQPPPPQKPVLELASARPVLVGREVPGIEVWFHVDPAADVIKERIGRIGGEGIEVWAETEDEVLVQLPFERTRRRHNVYDLALDLGSWREAAFTPYLRVLVHPEAIRLEGFGGDAASYAEDRGILWHDTQLHSGSGRDVVVLWVRMDEVVDR